jgi:hypothetical protein
MPPVDLKPAPSPEAAAPAQPLSAEPRRWAVRLAQVIVLAFLFAAPAFICIHTFEMSDTDIWWHLGTGEWIATHHAVPHFEPFSRPAAGTPWVAYSWAFEFLVFRVCQVFGSVGIALYTAGMVLLTTVALYGLVQRERLELPTAALATFASMYAMGHLYTPRPWLFTILFFICELAILMHARRTGTIRHLVWLPIIFAFWANVHIQFVDGLFVLGLAVAEALSTRWWAGAQCRVRARPLLIALAASIAATLANPYGWRLYTVARDLATQSGALDKITELQAIPFRDPAAYLVLLLAIASAAVLGWQRRILSFEAALLAFAALLSFRSQRDVWILAIVAAAILAPSLPKARKASELPSPGVGAAAFVVAVLIIAVTFRLFGINNADLRARLEQHMPVRAVDFVRQHGYRGPLFNEFNWGGFLIWDLRIPVAIDGRQNVYGDQRMDRSVATWGGQPDWASDPDLTSSRLVIGPVHTPLTQLLRRDSHYQLVYEDKIAAIFTARH